jgi:hypothetical protein
MSHDLTRERIEKRLNQVKRLFTHLVLTIVFALGMMWAVSQLDAPKRLEDDLIPIAVLAFIAHALWVMYGAAKQFIIDQEIGREERTDMEKPKRNSHLVVDNDGELLEVLDDTAWDEKPKHDYS